MTPFQASVLAKLRTAASRPAALVVRMGDLVWKRWFASSTSTPIACPASKKSGGTATAKDLRGRWKASLTCNLPADGVLDYGARCVPQAHSPGKVAYERS